MAEGQGFEPWVRRRTLVFKTSAFDHSATPPEKRGASIPCDFYLASFFVALSNFYIYRTNLPLDLCPSQCLHAWLVGHLMRD